MSAQEELIQSDNGAVEQPQSDGFNYKPSSIGNVVSKGKVSLSSSGSKKKVASIAAIGAIVVTFGLILGLFLSGNYQIDAISTLVLENFDLQRGDGFKSVVLVIQNQMKKGDFPENTAKRIEEVGAAIGYMDGDTFVASTKSPAIMANNYKEFYIDGKGEGGLPSNMVERLEQNDVEVEYSEGDDELVLKLRDGRIITAHDLYYAAENDVEVANVISKVTYGASGYWYDDAAVDELKRIGISLNTLSEDETLEETMNKVMGTDNIVGFNDTTWHYMPTYSASPPSCVAVLDPPEKWQKVQDDFDCTGTNKDFIPVWRTETFHPEGTVEVGEDGTPVGGITCVSNGYTYEYNNDYGCNGTNEETYMKAISQANMSTTSKDQTIKNTTDSLKAADTLSKEQKSMLFFSVYMESLNRVKAGYGRSDNDADRVLQAFGTLGTTVGGSHVNDVMNSFYAVEESKVVDVKTGEVKTLTGSMLQSPSLYSVLSGTEVDLAQVVDFSSDRILNTIENNTDYSIDDNTIVKTAASKNNDNDSAVGRYTNKSRDTTPSGRAIVAVKGKNYNWGDYDDDNIGLVELTVKNSMYSSYGDIKGITAGEMFIAGALGVGNAMADRSGGTHGDVEATTSYLNLYSDVVAMDAKVDRLNRSPFDITSKNTFLGSLLYKFAVSSMQSGSLLNKIATFSRITNKAVASISPAVFAEEETPNKYLSSYGEKCRTIERIHGVGSPQCSKIDIFDTTTYIENDESILESPSFNAYVDDNVKCDSNGYCDILEKSDLFEYLTYNTNSHTPPGLTNSAIVEDIEANKSGIAKLWSRVVNLFNTIAGIDSKTTTTIDKRATGEAFTMWSGNSDWDGGKQYKYAQRYISLARAIDMVRQHDGDENSFMIDGFGKGNPVARCLEKINQDTIATND